MPKLSDAFALAEKWMDHYNFHDEEEDKEMPVLLCLLAEEVRRLQKEVDFLECLEACGVDNWEGYYEARKMQKETNGLHLWN